MSRPLLIVLATLLLCANPCRADDSSSNGPSSASESSVLWSNGQTAFSDGRYSAAATELQRYVDRYPGQTGYLKAHLLLGKSLLETGQPERAAIALKYYVDAPGTKPDIAQARILLSRAYVALKQYNEAYLLCVETQKKLKEPDNAVLAESLIVKTEALIGMSEDARAQDSLEAARNILPPTASSALKGEAARGWLTLKDRACARLSSAGPQTEEQARDQLSRRGACLLEAVRLFSGVLDTGDPRSALNAEAEIGSAFEQYGHACDHPPKPPRLSPVDRSQAQLKRYNQELTALLRLDCQQKYSDALQIVNEWKLKEPMSKFASQFTQALRQLTRTRT